MAANSSPDTYTDPALRDKLKAQIKDGEKGGRAGEWSARKSQLLAAEYKKAGGGYKKSRKTEDQKNLDDWTKQDWRTEDGQPVEHGDETARYLPAAAWEKLTPAQRKATNAKKLKASVEKQFVSNTDAAKAARKAATSQKEK